MTEQVNLIIFTLKIYNLNKFFINYEFKFLIKFSFKKAQKLRIILCLNLFNIFYFINILNKNYILFYLIILNMLYSNIIIKYF